MKNLLTSLLLLASTAASAVVEEPVPVNLAPGVQTSFGQRQHRARHLRRAVSYPDATAKRGLLILVDFPDVAFSEPTPVDTWRRIANEKGYREGLAVGSVHDYFLDQSGGLFDLTFDVVGPVTMSHLVSYYGENDENGEDLRVGELVVEACRAIDDEVDFDDYDWDADGEVDQVYVLYAGMGENSNTRQVQLIWAHEYWLSGYDDLDVLELDGVVIDTYACSGEIASRGQLSGIGTICHEFSHCLGLPDIYNVASGHAVLGAWDVMDMGNYNAGGWCPPNFSAYERYFCGWLEPEVLDAPRSVRAMGALGEGGTVYRIDGPTPDQYYLLENRQRHGWDTSLPGHGLKITYVDYDAEVWELNTVNAVSGHYRLHYYTDTTSIALSTVHESADGLVSFDYQGGDADAVAPALRLKPEVPTYDLGNGIYIRHGRKYFRRR